MKCKQQRGAIPFLVAKPAQLANIYLASPTPHIFLNKRRVPSELHYHEHAHNCASLPHKTCTVPHSWMSAHEQSQAPALEPDVSLGSF